jgi:hypothetical protein
MEEARIMATGSEGVNRKKPPVSLKTAKPLRSLKMQTDFSFRVFWAFSWICFLSTVNPMGTEGSRSTLEAGFSLMGTLTCTLTTP